jgi:hypothetical protein
VSAYKKLSVSKARWFAIHADARAGLFQALLGRAQGQSRQHVATGILAALDPDGSHFIEWKAQMMRLQASGLELTEAATRQVAFMNRQVRRTARKLGDGD